MARPASRSPERKPAQLGLDEMRSGIARIKKLVERVEQFDPNSITDQFNIPEIVKLSAAIDEGLIRTFGPDTLDYERYKSASHFNNGPFNYAHQVPIQAVQRSLERSKQHNSAMLRQAFEDLEERLSEFSTPASSAASRPNLKPHARKIFIVHGREEGPREATARFLEKLGFEVVILHEVASRGRTVIEKIEAHSEVGFAVILVTPDDEGCLKGEAPVPRARQNVLLELGYFVGKLGRKNVCVLQRGEVEIPSDWRGVIDHPFDAGGGWKRTLAKELEAAGFEIDWKKAD